MPTMTPKSRPGSPLRLLTLLATAHAALAFYLWFCAYDLSVELTAAPLWRIISALWLAWPALLAVRAAAPAARVARRALRPGPAFDADQPRVVQPAD